MKFLTKFLGKPQQKANAPVNDTDDPIDATLAEINRLARLGLENPDEYRKYVNAEKIVRLIYPKYKFSEFGRIFLEDKSFQEYYARFMDPNNWHSLDRKYVLNELLSLTDFLEGDFVECGVYQGATAYLLCAHGTKSQKLIHLFDSFEGISEPNEFDGDYWTQGALSADLDSVKNNISEFDNYNAYVGWIPDKFHEVVNRRFCFVHIDVDLYEPTLESVKFFYPRLVRGGILLFDDYGFNSCPGAKRAVDEYFAECVESVIKLPTGQAFVIKQ